MQLYPLKFRPILKHIIWGGSKICQFKNIEPQQDVVGESWELSGVRNSLSVVTNGDLKGKNIEELIADYKSTLVGEKVYSQFGTTFPLLIKFIDALDDLSIQVHPDDELSKKRHNSLGKTEMWYVIDAAKDAFLYSGFEKQMTADNYVETINNNSFVDYLAKHDVKKGDVFLLPAGRVHAIGAGTFILEVQQTSDITYRICDYNRKDANGNERELHTELAKDAIDYKIYESYRVDYKQEKNEAVELESCPYFTTKLLDLDKPMKQDYSKKDSFVVYICIAGSCSITDNKGNLTNIKQGETVLIPADTELVEIQPNENVLLVETYV